MKTRSHVELQARGVLGVNGPDAREFLQNLVTNDMEQVSPGRAVYAALLTPQGKFLHEFIVMEGADGGFLLDCEASRLMDLGKRLAAYKLRAAVEVADLREDLGVFALFGPGAATAAGLSNEAGAAAPFGGGVACVDPRTAELGVRALLPRDTSEESIVAAGFEAAPIEAFEQLRLGLGVPDGSRDIAVEKATLAEAGFEALHGVDFTKGCYVGQEVTTRMKHRGTARKRLVPVTIAGDLPPPGTPIMAGDKEIGELRSGVGNKAIAAIRADRLAESGATGLTAAGAAVTVTALDPRV